MASSCAEQPPDHPPPPRQVRAKEIHVHAHVHEPADDSRRQIPVGRNSTVAAVSSPPMEVVAGTWLREEGSSGILGRQEVARPPSARTVPWDRRKARGAHWAFPPSRRS